MNERKHERYIRDRRFLLKNDRRIDSHNNVKFHRSKNAATPRPFLLCDVPPLIVRCTLICIRALHFTPTPLAEPHGVCLVLTTVWRAGESSRQ